MDITLPTHRPGYQTELLANYLTKAGQRYEQNSEYVVSLVGNEGFGEFLYLFHKRFVHFLFIYFTRDSYIFYFIRSIMARVMSSV